ERRRAQLAGVYRLFKWAGIGLGGLVVAAGLTLGGALIYRSYAGSVSGPFGSIKRTELQGNRFTTIQTTQGNIKIELDTKHTPKTAANFVLLAKKSFYDGVQFHRIMKDFMIQAGDPLSKDEDPSNDGTGGPGYAFPDEKFTGEYTRGTVAMANSGVDTNGSQFFIMQKDTNLPKNYVIFGKVVSGMDIVDKIAETPVEDNGQGEQSRAVKDKEVIINRIILSNN
ncbi:MAG: peptidylprolyl isomerase, partial [bacterium]